MSLSKKALKLEPIKAANENKKEREGFNRDTSVEVRTAGVKALQAFKSRFLSGKENIPELKILMIDTETDVSVMEVFGESDVTFVEKVQGSAERLKKQNLNAFKGNYRVLGDLPDEESGKESGDGFDVVVILDQDAEPTTKFLKNISGGGFVLCRARMAGAMRGTGNYEVMGAIDEEGPTPTLAKGSHGEMWGEVGTDEEFQKESEKPAKGLVTYKEAIDALKGSGIEEGELKKIIEKGRVLEEYRHLLEDSPARGSLKGIPWKTQSESTIFVLKKSNFVG